MAASRLYMGRLPPNVTKQDVEDHFKGFQLSDIRLLGNFGFLEFSSQRDADDAVRDLAGRDFMGESIILEHPRETRRRDTYEARDPRGGDRPFVPRSGGGGMGGPPRKGVRDLKDYGRIGSSDVIYADVDRNNPGNGIIEFGNMAEAEEAISRLSGVDINNTPVKLEIAPDDGSSSFRGPPRQSYDRPRYDDRGPPRNYDRPRYDDRRDDRRRDDRPPRRDYDRDDRDRDSRRDREYVPRDRSPPRRRDDDRYVDREARTG